MASGYYSCLLLSSFNWDDSSLLSRGKSLSSALRETTHNPSVPTLKSGQTKSLTNQLRQHRLSWVSSSEV